MSALREDHQNPEEIAISRIGQIKINAITDNNFLIETNKRIREAINFLEKERPHDKNKINYYCSMIKQYELSIELSGVGDFIQFEYIEECRKIADSFLQLASDFRNAGYELESSGSKFTACMIMIELTQIIKKSNENLENAKKMKNLKEIKRLLNKAFEIIHGLPEESREYLREGLGDILQETNYEINNIENTERTSTAIGITENSSMEIAENFQNQARSLNNEKGMI